MITVPMIVMIVAAAVWLVSALSETSSKALTWLSEAARLVFFAAALAVLLSQSRVPVF